MLPAGLGAGGRNYIRPSVILPVGNAGKQLSKPAPERASFLGLGISLTGFVGKFRRSCNVGRHAGTSREGMPAYVAGASELTKETCKRNAEA